MPRVDGKLAAVSWKDQLRTQHSTAEVDLHLHFGSAEQGAALALSEDGLAMGRYL